jgi:hypothetical protein
MKPTGWGQKRRVAGGVAEHGDMRQARGGGRSPTGTGAVAGLGHTLLEASANRVRSETSVSASPARDLPTVVGSDRFQPGAGILLPMSDARAALFLDFDNVFSGLFNIDPEVAVKFASDPGTWLHRLSTTFTREGSRRWLILRCYLNPSGSVPHLDDAGQPTRLFFSRFRPSFVRAGFEVIDCPRYSGTKNAADIRIVVDAIDALADDTRYDEFVIGSGDSDMTPLLQRLRRADRRTMIVSPADAATAFTAIADHTLDSQQVVALVQGETIGVDDDSDANANEEAAEPEGPLEIGGPGKASPVTGELYQEFRSVVEHAYKHASEPVNLASLASRIHAELGSRVGDSNWFGFGSFTRAMQSLGLPNLQVSQHFMWDEQRHTAPQPSVRPSVAAPEPVDRLVDQLDLPRLPTQWWPAIYQALSDYAQGHQFNLTQCTSWARDRLHEEGLGASRNNVAFVVRGASYGGRPLHRRPAPNAAEIRDAFIANVLDRAEAAGIVLTEGEAATVRDWLTGSSDDTGDSIVG